MTLPSILQLRLSLFLSFIAGLPLLATAEKGDEARSQAAPFGSLESSEVRQPNASLEPQRLDGANGKRIPGTLKGRDGLYAVPIMQREGMPYPILGVGIANDGNNPLSPPCIPPKFVLHGLSARSKFLAVNPFRQKQIPSSSSTS